MGTRGGTANDTHDTARKGSVKYLNTAKSGKNDEFYTILTDIEKELRHYKKHFSKKTVLCNCDDPKVSNFFVYFSNNFGQLGLKKLITTCYKNQDADLFSKHTSKVGVYLEYEGEKNGNRVPTARQIGIHRLEGDGDFRSEECVRLLEQADIVVTNPPFSLFREYVAQLVAHRKKFLIIGTWNAIIYTGIFELIRDDKLWIGVNSNRNFSGFIVPKHYTLHGTEARIDENGNRIVSTNTTCWFTNIDNKKRHEDLILYKTYNPREFPKYDNYDAIEVSKTADIPMDYTGIMGVPVTFLDKYNPEQFEIIGSNRGIDQDPNGIYGRGSYLNGKETFKRLFIRNKRPT
jgi:Adenine-specific methyltransferase EcoRI